MERQLLLPGFRHDDLPLVIHRIETYVTNCQSLLAALGIRRADVVRVLAWPEDHWHKVILHRGAKRRVCYSPSAMLRKIHKRLWHFLRNHRSPEKVTAWEEVIAHHDYAKPICNVVVIQQAFWRGSSIVRNAQLHRRNQSSWVIDLRDAFASVRVKHIQRFLQRTIRYQEYSVVGSAAWVMSRLVTFRGRLQQGSTVAPLVFNLLMERFDIALAQEIGSPIFWGQRSASGLIYTRYGDDLCFSSPETIFPAQVKERINSVIHCHHLCLNTGKRREGQNGIMELPGVVIVHGEIRPRLSYLTDLVEQRCSGKLSQKQLDGHKAFLLQFGRRTALRLYSRQLHHFKQQQHYGRSHKK